MSNRSQQQSSMVVGELNSFEYQQVSAYGSVPTFQENNFIQEERPQSHNTSNIMNETMERDNVVNRKQYVNQAKSLKSYSKKKSTGRNFEKDQKQLNFMNNNQKGQQQSQQQQQNLQQQQQIEKSSPLQQVKKNSWTNQSLSAVGTVFSKMLNPFQQKTQMYNEDVVQDWFKKEKQEYYNFFKKKFGYIQSEDSFINHLSNDVNQIRNKILEKISYSQRQNLSKINDHLQKFSFTLYDYSQILKNMEDEYITSDTHSWMNQTFHLDEILYDQTYLMQRIEDYLKQKTTSFNFQQSQQDLISFKQMIRECLQERLENYDIQIKKIGEGVKVKKIRVHVISRLLKISSQNNTGINYYSFQKFLPLGTIKQDPTDNEIIIHTLIGYFNQQLTEIYSILQKSISKKAKFSNPYASIEYAHTLQNFEKILIALKIEYSPKYVSYIKLSEDQDAKKNQVDQYYKQEDEVLYSHIYFVKKNPIGTDLQIDIYSNGIKYVTKPGEHNVNCCLFYYGQCVQQKLDQIRGDLQGEWEKLHEISEFKYFLSQLKELNSRYLQSHYYTHSSSNQLYANSRYQNRGSQLRNQYY